MADSKLISVVIPCYNEEKNIDRTFNELLELKKARNYDLEVIAVNDGSKDNTWSVIEKYSKKYKEIKGINLMGNYGQSAAYQAGFDLSKGDYVLILSADLEIPIENVKAVIEKLDEGYDFVNTNRVNRWGAERAVKSGLANKIITSISGVDMKDRGSGLKGFKRVIVENVRLYGEMHRFLPDYASVCNAKMTEFDVKFKDRDYGESYYKKQNRTVRVILDLATLAFMLYFAKKPFTMMPGRLFGFTGMILGGVGGLGTLYLILEKLLFGTSIGSRPALTFSVVLVIVGLQLFMFGLLGELLVRVYFEGSNRKTYAVRQIIA